MSDSNIKKYWIREGHDDCYSIFTLVGELSTHGEIDFIVSITTEDGTRWAWWTNEVTILEVK